MCKNVVVPLFLLERIIYLLEDLEPPEYHSARFEYCDILWALGVKMQRLEPRKAYASVIMPDVDDTDSRCLPRIYHRRRRNQPDYDYDCEDDLPF